MRRALLIGINNYPGRSHLNGCVEDIHCLKKSIERNEDGSKNFGVKLMEDVETSEEIMEGIKNLFHDDAEVALLYFSGHGYVNESGAVIVTPNDVVNGSYYKGVQMSDIMEIVHNSKVKNKVIILDCCHSGEIGKPNVKSSESSIGQGVSILTACREDESAVEAEGHGLFTELLCNALNGGAADFNGNISIGSVYAYIDRSFGEWDQRPVFKTNVCEFVSLKNVQPKVSLDVFRQITKIFSTPGDLLPLDPSYEFTNSPGKECKVVKPYADENNVKTLQILQKLQSIGLVEPVGAEHMYFAAMYSKSCRLTALGKHYWRLVKNNNI